MRRKDDWMNAAMAAMATLFLLLAASAFIGDLHANPVAAADVSSVCELRVGGCKTQLGKICPENEESCKFVDGICDCAK